MYSLQYVDQEATIVIRRDILTQSDTQMFLRGMRSCTFIVCGEIVVFSWRMLYTLHNNISNIVAALRVNEQDVTQWAHDGLSIPVGKIGATKSIV